jgi:hypothetical protein
LPEIELRFARRVGERHENFRRLLLVASNLIANGGDPALVIMLVAKPLEYAFARMALLLVDLLVGLQNLVNDRNEWPDHRLVPLDLLAMLGRLLALEDLLNGPKIQVVLLDRFAAAQPAGEHVAADLGPFIHLVKHSFPSRS